ncbi:hypothetical protein Plhal304r1_c074g0162161 [Plasmopara halstedii]
MIVIRDFQNDIVNLLSLSLMITSGKPWCRTTASKNVLAVTGASSFAYTAAYIVHFDNLSTKFELHKNHLKQDILL